MVRAFGPPGGLRQPESGQAFEEERERPLVEEGFGAEERRVVPVEVAGDLGGDEEL